MADLTRPYSVQSFASNESLSFAPSMTTAPSSTVSLSANSSRFYLSDGNIKFKVSPNAGGPFLYLMQSFSSTTAACTTCIVRSL